MTGSISRRTVLGYGAGLGAVGLAGAGHAAQTIRMTAIDGYPARAMWVKEFSGFFIPEVNKALAASGEYKIDWQEAYGGSIVKPKGVLEGIQLGLGDIGIVTTIFHNSKLPSQALSAVTPFISSDARVVAKAVDEIATEFPAMQQEFQAENQVYLATGVVLDSYQVFSSAPLNSLADLQGRKVAGAGYNLRYLEGVPGTAGVRGGLTDFYNLVQTGVTEAAMLWPEAANTFKIVEVAPNMLRADLGAVNTKTVTINKDVWDKLPAPVQQALRDVSIKYRDHVASVAMDRAAVALEAYQSAGGKVVSLSEAERKAWADAMPNIAVEWASGLDSAGKAGSEMLRAYMGKLRDAGMTPARDWAADLA